LPLAPGPPSPRALRRSASIRSSSSVSAVSSRSCCFSSWRRISVRSISAGGVTVRSQPARQTDGQLVSRARRSIAGLLRRFLDRHVGDGFGRPIGPTQLASRCSATGNSDWVALRAQWAVDFAHCVDYSGDLLKTPRLGARCTHSASTTGGRPHGFSWRGATILRKFAASF